MPRSLDDRVFELAADLFGLLAAPTRLRIICALIEGERNVSELLDSVSVSQPNMSQHLGTLYRSGLLARRRTGPQVFYRLEHEQARRLCMSLKRERSQAAGRPATSSTRRRSAPSQ